MSSRIFLPGDPAVPAPVRWKQLPSAAAAAATPPAPREPDKAAEAARREKETQERVREAYATGLREGDAAGRNRAAAELQPVVERFAATIGELTQLRARLRQQAESDTIRLALAIARRVLRRELSVDPEALRGLLLAALDKLQGQEVARVRVHPSHAAVLRDCLQKKYAGAQIEMVTDSGQVPGTAVFETSRGNLDASVETQLEEIERGLTDRLQRA
jgi:flagellar assembly protein FliH